MTAPQSYLLTPGPLTTSLKTRQALLKDHGSWDDDFNDITRSNSQKILRMCGGEKEFTCIPMQGSGTFSVEAAIASCIPEASRTLILINGAYGKRIETIFRYLKRPYITLDKGDYLPPRATEVEQILQNHTDITDVMMVHCETSSGILNPVKEIGIVAKKHHKTFHIDAMSSFGGIPLATDDIPFDVCISSANKCIEGVPGFGFVIVRTGLIEGCKNRAHSLSLDLYDQWQGFQKTNKWRFTPPTHVVAAFAEALNQHDAEGGVVGRYERYCLNQKTLVAGMRKLGFKTLLEDEWLSPIITTFMSPGDQAFEFSRFYKLMKNRGFIIYPGKLTVAESFRMGTIGQLFPKTMEQAVEAVAFALDEMGIKSAKPHIDSIRHANEYHDHNKAISFCYTPGKETPYEPLPL